MDYANIKTYIETSYRNGINPMDALFRLSIGVPFTLKEILNNEKLSEEKQRISPLFLSVFIYQAVNSNINCVKYTKTF